MNDNLSNGEGKRINEQMIMMKCMMYEQIRQSYKAYALHLFIAHCAMS